FVFITHTLIYSIYTLSLHDALPIFYRTRSIGKYPTTIAIQIGYANGGGIKKQYTDKNGYQTANKIAEKLWEYIYSNGDHEALYRDRKSTRLNSSHVSISYAVFCLKK